MVSARKPVACAFILVAHTSRACEAEPSGALRQQTDPLEPAGRRFANFFFEQFFFEIPASGANAGAIGAAPGEPN